MLRFGTDGLRGLANAELSPELVMALGRAAAGALGVAPGHERRQFIVGRDTRRSGPLLQAALAAGLASEGMDVSDVGVLPTPAVAFLSAAQSAPAAVISASHNPFGDNGVKFFAAGGTKLSDEAEEGLEARLEALMAGRDRPWVPTGGDVGFISPDPGALARYERHVLSCLEGRDLGGLRVALDCANGAAYISAPAVFEAAGAQVVSILAAEPDGANINRGCGSTDPRRLAESVVGHHADLGLAFDGDADRVIAVDAAGNVVDGDRLLALFATDLSRRGLLRGGTVVVTVMTNVGFHEAMAAAGVKVQTVAVGDRYVLEALDANGWALGGEQSGHIVFRSLATTGDGLLSGLLLADLVTRRSRSLADMAAAALTRWPQVLRNVTVADRDGLAGAVAVWEEVEKTEQVLGPHGRVLLRPSGTEALVRVMVEAATEDAAEEAVERIVSALRAALGSTDGPWAPAATFVDVCGIVAVLARAASRPAPDWHEVERALAEAVVPLSGLTTATGPADPLRALQAATATLVRLNRSLLGVPGLTCLIGQDGAVEALERGAAQVGSLVAGFEAALDGGQVAVGPEQLEELNAALVRLHDAAWALGTDRAGSAKAVAALVVSLGLSGPRSWRGSGVRAGSRPSPPGPAALAVLWAVQVALSALDRLEIRGRDSAGLHLMLSGPGLDLASPELQALVEPRAGDPLFASRGARSADGCLSLVYKAAAEIGELGDNVAALRQALGTDPLLARALAGGEVTATVVAHTRWASVGLISQANAHPLNGEEVGGQAPGPYVIGALNGDIDNYAEIVARENIRVPPQMTTDAKVIPTLVSRHMAAGDEVGQAFGQAVGRLEGSVGIVVNAARATDELFLSVRGSGQSLNIGLAEDAFVVASEPYGLVEETSRYLRMSGESGGQVVRLRRPEAGTLAGTERRRYDGTAMPVAAAEVRTAEITTRDVDRRGFKHFLLKEICESPLSVRKTLRGKLVTGTDGHLAARLGDDVVPPGLRAALASGAVHSVFVIGQGTAAVAGEAVAAAISGALPDMAVKAMPATELSGWGPAAAGLPDDMSGALVVAISQSGTTTDTNRTVALVRARRAHVVSIVNRRHSDLVQNSHGVLYTSDGRDVEMSVASTKAFYSQVAAGHLLALALAEAAGQARGPGAGQVLGALRDLPSLMDEVLAQRPEIARVASAVAPGRRSWAVVGSGPDRVAAAEVRIKLSELCYKAVALDTVEDKKHIDLSAEPLVIVCAPSAQGPNARDIAKEVEIFRAHKAAPVVIVAESVKGTINPDVDIITVPDCHPALAFVLAALVGHIFGYEAALAIDSQARPLREARSVLERATRSAQALVLEDLAPALEAAAAPALAGLRGGAYDGHLNASTASRVTALLRYATGALPVESYEAEMGKVGAPRAIAGDLIAALGQAIDELTRSIDAIKHQAKTVTVGISRSEETLLRAPLVSATLAAGASVESLGYRALRTLAALGPAVEAVLGYTRYRVETHGPVPGAPALDGATIDVVDRGGLAAGIPSRTATDNALRGTKHRAAEKREVTVFKGLHDGRTGIIVPEVKDGQVTGITLLHARFAPVLSPEAAKGVLRPYQGRYAALVDAVTEGRPRFDDAALGRIPVIELLTEPVAVLARHWTG